MSAIKETIEAQVEVLISGKPLDPMREINSPLFLKALLSGPPATERSFRYLVIHMQAPLTRYLARWLRDSQAIQDVLQETFLAVHRGLPRFEGNSSLTTWVHRLAHHKAMDRLADQYRPDGRNAADDACMEMECSRPLPDEEAHKGLLIARIQAVAESLPELYRAVWKLRDLEGKSAEAAAEALGLTPALAAVRLHRARALILARLRKEQPELIREMVREGGCPAPVRPGIRSRPARSPAHACAGRRHGNLSGEMSQ